MATVPGIVPGSARMGRDWSAAVVGEPCTHPGRPLRAAVTVPGSPPTWARDRADRAAGVGRRNGPSTERRAASDGRAAGQTGSFYCIRAGDLWLDRRPR